MRIKLINKKGLLDYKKADNLFPPFFEYLPYSIYISSIFYNDIMDTTTQAELKVVLDTIKDNIEIYPDEEARKSLNTLFSRGDTKKKVRSQSNLFHKKMIELCLNIKPIMLNTNFLKNLKDNYFKALQQGEVKSLKDMVQSYLREIAQILGALKPEVKYAIDAMLSNWKGVLAKQIDNSFSELIKGVVGFSESKKKAILDRIFYDPKKESKRREKEKEINKSASLAKIESIPNWQDNEFLASVHRNVKRSRSGMMTPKQELYVDKYVFESQKSAPRTQIRKGVSKLSLKSWLNDNSIGLEDAIADLKILRKKDSNRFTFLSFISTSSLEEDLASSVKEWTGKENRLYSNILSTDRMFFAQSQALFMKSPYIIMFSLPDSKYDDFFRNEAHGALKLFRGDLETKAAIVWQNISMSGGSTSRLFFIQPYWCKYFFENYDKGKGIYKIWDSNSRSKKTKSTNVSEFLAPLNIFLHESGYFEKFLRYDEPKKRR